MAIIRQILRNVPPREAGRKEKTMARKACRVCGKEFDDSLYRGPGNVGGKGYCSTKCMQEGEAAGRAESAANFARIIKLIGIVFVALVTLFTLLCYKFPKFLAKKSKKFLYAYIIAWVALIAGAVIYFSFFSPEAVSGIKTKIVSASCETEEQFVSILKEASSKASWAVIEGEEFTTYSLQALDVVKERHSTFKDSVYFVRLPDSVNVYVWFKTEDQASAYVYKTI
jgi:hypothetical protein